MKMSFGYEKQKNWGYTTGTDIDTNQIQNEDRNSKSLPTRFIVLGRLSYHLSIILIIAGVVNMIIFAVLFAKPYIYTLGFDEGTCETISSKYTGEWLKCNKGSTYPCLNIQVQTPPLSLQNGSMVKGQLHETEQDLVRDPQCTYKPKCVRGRAVNAERVAEYNSTWGKPGQQFTCLFNPHTSEFIRRQHGNTMMLVHIFLWPSLGIFIGITVITVIFMQLGCRRVYKKCNPYSKRVDSETSFQKV